MKRTELRRRTPMRRTRSDKRRKTIPGKVTPRRGTGFTRPQRATLAARDDHRCQGCGRNLAELRHIGLRLEANHRLPLGRGGKSTLDNGVMLCGLGNYAGCHRRVDHDREWGYARGLVLHTGIDPTTVLVIDYHGTHWHLLTDGTRQAA